LCFWDTGENGMHGILTLCSGLQKRFRRFGQHTEMTVHCACIRAEMFFLASLSFADQFAHELIKLIKGSVGQILRQLKEISDQERSPCSI